ncbi:MAG: 2-oxo acid dehydrogenase subunit E2 [Tatlockia sp.]|nr:2-oxo acid dehydrogenase subunit E2 [Tatlockia sp.]
MDELNELLTPLWGAQKEIMPIWNQISADEKKLIKDRMDDLFKNGLPFELKHEKTVYIQVFSFLAQVDVMACQVPFKFESKMPNPLFQKRLRSQLLDEIFHVLLSIKIVNILSSPYQSPPIFNEALAQFCEVVSNEECPKVAVALLNTLLEGVAEELVKTFNAKSFATEVFSIIVADERRHVSDAELYREIGLPEKASLAAKWVILEEFLLSSMLAQFPFVMSLMIAIGPKALLDYLRKVDTNIREQLNILHLKPSKKWLSSMQLLNSINFPAGPESLSPPEIEKTLHRKQTMTQWDEPKDPTMVGQFNIDISCLDFFNKKYPPETLTTLMLQTLSQLLVDHPEHQIYLSNSKLYQRQKARVGLVVKLPGCADHLGIISIENCHQMPVNALATHIRRILRMMAYCYKKRELLEREYPKLKIVQSRLFSEFESPFSKMSFPLSTGICLSNIGSCGYSQGKSPLLPNEPAKLTLFDVEKRLVWFKDSNSFEARDLLPVSLSVDHRIFDGQVPTPKLMSKIFQIVFAQMEAGGVESLRKDFNDQQIKGLLDNLIQANLEMAYLTLMTLQTMWPDYLSISDLLKLNSLPEFALG